MSTRLSAGRVRATYEFIKAHRHQYSVEAMCRVLEVAGSGYYDWLKQPRVFLDLRESGETFSKHRVARLMRQAGLRALHGYRTRRWAVGKPSVLIPNVLERQFTVTRRNKAWVTDITYIRTWQGWLYLAVVMDLFSRKVIGWAAGPTIHRELVLNAVLMAIRRRRPRGTIIHCGRRVLLQQPEERADQEAHLQDPGIGDRGHSRLHRGLPQWNSSPQPLRRSESRPV
jgi:putative transposase